MTPTRSAVVVGAGVAGLATAGALARTGWRVTLLERTDRLRGEPTALLLWPAAVRALQVLELGHGLDAIANPLPDRGVRRPDGQMLVQPDPAGARGSALLVHAEDFHDALVAGLGDRVEIRTGVSVRSTVPGERPGVTDGRTIWSADLVIGADGIDSVLRPRVAPRSTVVSAGATAWRAVIPWYRAPELPLEWGAGGHTIATRGRGTGYQFFSAPLGRRGAANASGSAAGRGGRYWQAIVTGAGRPEPPATQLQLLRRWFDGWHAPIGQLLTATEPGDLLQRELRSVRPAPNRYGVPAGSGAVVLLGDAGHGLPEQLGIGAGLALEDAATLVAMLREAPPGPTLQAAVQRYGAARRPRLGQVLRHSRRLAATGPVAGLAPVQARRRDRAAVVASDWQPPP